MTAARIAIVAVLLPLAITGALTLSAAATIDLFSSQGVTVAWAAVGMLEVTSLAGTLLWVLVQNRSLRRDAIVVTCGATGVALVAGVFAYGPVGAVAGVLLVALTHLASRAWREPWAETPEPAVEETPEPIAEELPPAEPSSEPLPAPSSYEEAVRWALGEFRAGRTAGWKRIAGHTGLTESPCRRASKQAREQHELESRPRLVAGGQQ